MHSRQRRGGLLLMAAFGLAGLGCPKEKPADTPATGTSAATTSSGSPIPDRNDRKLRIAVIPKGTANSFWQTVLAGAQAAGDEEKAEIIWQGPSKEGDITEQINVVQTQITNKVDGIVLAACDAEALAKPVKDAVAKNIPVVTVDSGIKKEQDASLCYIATDNVAGGRAAADALAKLIGEKGNVGVLIFLQGAASSDQRENGFKEGIQKYPNIHIVQTLETQSEAAKAVNQTEAMLTAHKDLAGIFAANEPNGVGAAQVLKQRKLDGKVKLVAFDTSAEEVKALQEGTIQALIVQDPYQMGYKGVKTVLKAIRKETIPEKTVDSGLKVVTKDNLNTPEVQKLVNPGK